MTDKEPTSDSAPESANEPTVFSTHRPEGSQSANVEPGAEIDVEKSNEICREFEEAWRASDAPPQILDFARRAPTEYRSQLVVKLLRLDIEMHRLHNVDINSESYSDVLSQLDEKSKADCLGVLNTLVDVPETMVRPVQLMGRYELRAQLGRGGFGSVFRAWDTQLERYVAVKIPSGNFANPDHSKLFLREAKAAARLEHECLVRVLDFGINDGTAYIVFELVEGLTLSTLLSHQKPTVRDSAEIVSQIASALAVAHRKKIIHRDIKPSNILLEQETNRPRLADFGLAKIVDDADTIHLTGEVMGTPYYMSPEQALGQGADERSDVYSLGVVLYELLSGQRPFEAGDKTSVLQLVAYAEPKYVRDFDSALPIDLCTICHKAIEKTPTDRYQSANELEDDLQRWLNGEPIAARPISIFGKVARKAKRNPVVSALSVFAAIAVVVAAAAIARPSQTIREVVEVEAFSDGKLPVRIETEPPGAKITFVRLDDELHEPDPDTLVNTPGVSPITYRLSEGFYLVIAVLPDGRFHEVIRRVPNPATADRGIGPRILSWTWDDETVSYEAPIKVPDAGVPTGMCRIEPTNARGRRFFVGCREVINAEVPESTWLDLSGEQVPPNTASASQLAFRTDYWKAAGIAETLGGRLPSILELNDLLQLPSANDCEPGIGYSIADVGTDQCDTIQQGDTKIFGIRSGVSEWASTRFGDDPYQGKEGIVSLAEHWRDEQFAIGPFPDEPKREGNRNHFGQQSRIQPTIMGFRIVKSETPRVSRENFLSLETLLDFRLSLTNPPKSMPAAASEKPGERD